MDKRPPDPPYNGVDIGVIGFIIDAFLILWLCVTVGAIAALLTIAIVKAVS